MKPEPDMNNSLVSDKVLFFGRTLAEYCRMFNLNTEALKGKRVLDCPSGPASFIAECNWQGIMAVGCDPLYVKSSAEICNLAKTGMEDGLKRQDCIPQLSDDQKSMADYKREKLIASGFFCKDYASAGHVNRYIAAALPSLPFADGSFALALSSNFLFLYSDYEEGGMLLNSPFTYEFHLNSVLELMRVAPETRLYPLKGFHKDEHAFVCRLSEDLNSQGYQTSLEAVPYRDIKGAHHMMRIVRPGSDPPPT